jgi:UDP-N-acetylmuramoyl-tripeptide--D-alanyl-D-alanine ligase
MSGRGEIARLVRTAEPDVRVWTNVGEAHLGAFGSIDDIADAKAEITEAAGSGTVLVANADDPLIASRLGRFPGRLVTFGVESVADVRASDVVSRGMEGQSALVTTPGGAVTVDTPLAGRGNLENLLAAVAVATTLGVPLEQAAERASTLRAARHRGDVLRLGGGVVVIDDVYNSNPRALRMALDTLAESGAGRRVAVLGEMLELGTTSEALHRACGEAVAAAGVKALVTVGGDPARQLGEAARLVGLADEAVHHVADASAAAELVPSVVRPGDTVLVKGSRGVGLERVVDRLKVELA